MSNQEHTPRSKTPTGLSLWPASCLLLCILLAAQTPFASAGARTGKAGLPLHAYEPAGAPTLPRIGIEAQWLDDDAALTNVANLGISLVRVHLSWAEIEPQPTTPDNYNWTPYDTLFSRIAAKGLSPMVMVLVCPQWACTNDSGPINNGQEAEFARFMGALAARYSRQPYNVHTWELFNEPDFTTGADHVLGWGMHPAEYEAMLAQTYPAIKGADPNSVVTMGGLAYDFWLDQGGPFNHEFLPGVLDAGGAAFTDYIPFHYYINNAHGWTQIGLKAAVLSNVLAQHGAGSVPLICNETGLSSDPAFGGSELGQARYLVEANARGAEAGLRSVVWFLNRDFTSSDPGQQYFTQSGITRLDNTTKLSYSAMQTLQREIGSGDFLGRMNITEGVADPLEGYNFLSAASGLPASVVWNAGNGDATLTLPARLAPLLIRVTSMDGQAVATEPGAGGTVLVPMGESPVYLEWRARFSDVPVSSWAYPYVEYLVGHNIVSGYPDGTFRPESNATRAQFAKMVALGTNLTLTTNGGPHFADVPSTSELYIYIEAAFNSHIVSGYPCGAAGEPCPGQYFRPNAPVSRGQLAKMLVLAKNWPPENPAQSPFSDVLPGSTFYTYLVAAWSRGIISGYPDNSCRPNSPATRAELSKMLALTMRD